MREYEVRYEMSSEKMATLLELDAINPTAEVLRWYSAYQGAKLLRAKTPHDWNSWDHYQNHPRKPAEPSILSSSSDTLAFH